MQSDSSSLSSVFSADGVAGLPENKAALGLSALCCDVPAGVDDDVARLQAALSAMTHQPPLLTVSRDFSENKAALGLSDLL